MAFQFETKVHRDIFYLDSSSDPQQALDLYIPSEQVPTDIDHRPPVLVYIHGGGWCARDKSDFAFLGQNLSQLGSLAVAMVNYRLSTRDRPGIKHPAHVQDVALALHWISQHGEQYGYREDKIYIIGHSAGACITGQLIFTPNYLNDLDSTLYQKIRGVVGIEGIYDIPLLLRTWPDYIDFIGDAFGQDATTYISASPQHQSISNLSPPLTLPPYLIIHSSEDELVDLDQSKNYLNHIREEGAKTAELDTSLTGKHYAMLENDELHQKLLEFIMTHVIEEADWTQLVNVAIADFS